MLVVNLVGLRLGCICSIYSVSEGGNRGKEIKLRDLKSKRPSDF